MLSVPFVAMFVAIVAEWGWLHAVGVALAAGVTAGCALGGLWLLTRS
ncbi:hypothetical protein [Nonomuraea typhae]|uniref:Uncharacterized protein n=1 Tax=Nonomuraea typhae TaxID=2603600 RepID=A0ABW7YMN0_9ACTN